MMKPLLRPPVAAGRFYAGDPASLRAEVARCMPEQDKSHALAVIVPHAGYIYSGATAGAALGRAKVPAGVLLLGPNHTGLGHGCALSPDDWQIPGADIPANRDLNAAILRHCRLVQEDRQAHSREHSLEVLLPFLHRARPDLQISALCLGGLRLAQCQELATGLHAALMAYGRPVLLVASTDMNHYESRAVGSRKDRAAIARIVALDAAGLFDTVRQEHISMCGCVPVTVALLVALALGAKKAELVRYTDSGETSGDTAQVVGYAALLIV